MTKEHIIQTKGNEVVKLYASDFNNKTYVHIRTFYKKDSEYLPSKKGVVLHSDALEELIDGLSDIFKTITKT